VINLPVFVLCITILTKKYISSNPSGRILKVAYAYTVHMLYYTILFSEIESQIKLRKCTILVKNEHKTLLQIKYQGNGCIHKQKRKFVVFFSFLFLVCCVTGTY